MNLSALFRNYSLSWLSRGLHLGGLVCTLAIVVVGWQMRLHLAAQRAAAIELRQQAAANIAQEQLIRDQLTSLQTTLATSEVALKMLAEKVVDGPQESRFIACLDEIANRLGIDIRNFRPGRSIKHGLLEELELQISCAGDYRGLCKFLEAQEDLPRFCHVAGMTVAGQPGDADQLHFDLTLQLLFKSVAAAETVAVKGR